MHLTQGDGRLNPNIPAKQQLDSIFLRIPAEGVKLSWQVL